MGLMMRRRMMRRRALVAGAAVGGIAYHQGRKRQMRDEAEAEGADAYEELNQPAQAPAPPAPPQGDTVDELKRLASLHDSGALTDDEFSAAKARLLGT